MTDQSLFEDEPKEIKVESDQTPSSTVDVFSDQLKLITNDDGEPKYKDVPTALEALAHSQNFIKQLQEEKNSREEEFKRLQAEMESRESVESLINKVTGKTQEQHTKEDQPKVEGLDEGKILSLIEKSFEQRSTQAQQESNLQTVTKNLSERFGDKAKSIIEQRAKELGTTAAQLKELSKTNPNMVVTLFETVQPISTSPSQTSLTSPPINLQSGDLPINTRSVARGGNTDAELKEEWRMVRDHTYNKLGISK